MNGSQGTVVDIVFATGDHPNHDLVANRMPIAVIVNFLAIVALSFFQSRTVAHGSLSNQKNKSAANVLR